MTSRREAAVSPSNGARSPLTQDVSTRKGYTAGATRILLVPDDTAGASRRVPREEEETRGLLLLLLLSMGEHLQRR